MLNNKQQPLGLKQFIQKIKQELLEEHDEDHPLFAIGQVELEISFTVERTMDGRVNFHVVQSGVEKAMDEIQKVTLRLDPLVTVEEVRKQLTNQQVEDARKKTMRGM